MKTAKQIKDKIKTLEAVKRGEDVVGTQLCDIKLRQLRWVLDEQDGPVDFEELTS